MRPSQAGLAIILRARPYRESDKIVSFLTRDFGKLTGIAMGAKNSRRRFANCLDPLTRVRVYFRTRPGAGLVFLESCDLLHACEAFAEPGKFAYASYLLELTDQLTGEGQAVPELYDLLDAGLAELERAPATAALLRTFELHLLHFTGYEPHFETCDTCRRPLRDQARAFREAAHLFEPASHERQTVQAEDDDAVGERGEPGAGESYPHLGARPGRAGRVPEPDPDLHPLQLHAL